MTRAALLFLFLLAGCTETTPPCTGHTYVNEMTHPKSMGCSNAVR
jgi:hypothetical protein